jgi:hypoxia-inducible factor 1-alpha inhibitor (HIF hydroxylase)
MGPKILEEYKKFSLETALHFKQLGGWDSLTNNLLLCGKTGFITPLHFDEQENLFAQLNGRKRARMFHPDNWFALYPYPNGHPCDRYTIFQIHTYVLRVYE